MPNEIIKPEGRINLFGIDAKQYGVVANTETGRILNQKLTAGRRFKERAKEYVISAHLRFDDECKNGHETFSITGEIIDPAKHGDNRFLACGCIHEDLAKHFPELAHLIKWHLTSTDGPMHYLANTLYHASDHDHNGLLKGERRQIKNGRTGELAWELVAINAPGLKLSATPTGDAYRDAETVPLFILEKNADGDKDKLPPVPVLEWRPWCTVGEGKTRELDKARHSAVWPEATDEELSVPREELKAKLEARLPALLTAFKADMLACGFLWPEVKEKKDE